MLCGIFGRYTLIFYQRNFDAFVVRRALPFPPNKVFFSFVCFFFFIQIIHEPGCANFIESRALFQSSRGCNCKLNTAAWLVELTYGHVVFICEELVGWPWEGAFHSKGTNTKFDRVGWGDIGHKYWRVDLITPCFMTSILIINIALSSNVIGLKDHVLSIIWLPIM